MASGTIKTGAWVLLWTNPSPTSNFAAQDVLVDLTGATEICVIFKSDTTASAFEPYSYVLTPEVDSSDGMNAIFSVIAIKIHQRYRCSIKRDRVSFGPGCVFNTYGTRTDGANYCIPWYIYAR